jgi:hypothetical protein
VGVWHILYLKSGPGIATKDFAFANGVARSEPCATDDKMFALFRNGNVQFASLKIAYVKMAQTSAVTCNQ